MILSPTKLIRIVHLWTGNYQVGGIEHRREIQFYVFTTNNNVFNLGQQRRAPVRRCEAEAGDLDVGRGRHHRQRHHRLRHLHHAQVGPGLRRVSGHGPGHLGLHRLRLHDRSSLLCRAGPDVAR